MAVKERSQIKGTDAQIKAFAGHNGVLAFATDTKSLHVLSGTAGTTTEFLPSNKVATKTELDGKLSLSGGTMTGDIQFTDGNILFNKQTLLIRGRTNDTYLEICPGTTSNFDSKTGASLMMTGRDYTGPVIPKGCFYLTAANENELKSLIGSPDGSLTWCDKPVLCGESGGFPVGFLSLYAGSNVPNGWFRCDGSTIADMATNYPKLYAVLGTNVLPNYSDRVPIGASSGINTAVEAGLPNITGNMIYLAGNVSGYLAMGSYPANEHGCFYSVQAAGPYALPQITLSNDAPCATTHFAASGSNSIYGSSTTVQPPAVKVAVLIRHD